MRRTPFLTMLGLALAALVPAAPAAGQTTCAVGEVCSHAVRASVEAVAQLALSHANTDLGTVAAADLSAGHKDAPAALGLTVQSNQAWQVSIRARDAVWDWGLSPDGQKPAADLLWALGAGPGNTPLTTVDATLVSGTATDGALHDLFLRSLWSWNDPPTSYTLAVEFTIATN
jgi:hypothetical protein